VRGAAWIKCLSGQPYGHPYGSGHRVLPDRELMIGEPHRQVLSRTRKFFISHIEAEGTYYFDNFSNILIIIIVPQSPQGLVKG